MKDYNGIEIPTTVESSKIEITVSQKYIGKYGTEENHILEDCTLEDWPGVDSVIEKLTITNTEVY